MSLLSRLAVQAARAYGMLVGGASTNVSADYLVVAGGGAGSAGGGGAGGLLTSTATLSLLTTYTVTVGAGGSAGSNVSAGTSGSNSIISGTGLSTITATGGGRGGIFSNAGGGANNGVTGGSGGGGGNSDTGYSAGIGAAGTSGQGNSGGNGTSFNTTGSSGGGGGAGAVGGNGVTSSNGGAGGVGLANSISGSSVFYAGGGSGGGSIATAGGNGGGGQGGGSSQAGSAGTANTGGGGGGAGNTSVVASGAGGSGIVIISYTSATPKFVGGTITTSGGKQIHTFTSSGTLSPITPITASYLVVAGGAGGGFQIGGGGGAGGYKESSTTLYSGATYVVTVGAGGAGDTASGGSGSNGSNSELSGTGLTTITSTGGGGGASNSGGTAQTGGSGGGGRGSVNGAAGTSGQGFAGGNGSTDGSTYTNAGGGGGASAVGSNATSSTGGNGGTGTASSITGTSTTYAGGGGGGAQNGGSRTAGTATGGGGAGGLTGAGSSGTPNLGAGGGGGGENGGTGYAGGNGGSGVVIISYAGSQAFNGGLVTTSGGNTIHTFTSSGALTPLTNNLNNSLRFRSSASAYLNRTPSVAGNSKTWTWSGWVKRGTLNSSGSLGLFEAFTSPYNSSFRFASDTLNFQQNDVSGRNITWGTSAVFRDPSAWYHIVLVCDTTQAAVGNAIKMYVNGNQQTVTATINSGSYAQNLDTYVNAVSISQRLGTYYNGNYFDGYLADVYLIDGQALEPYYFGNNDANQVWKPIQYKGTYGTNGFYLTFGNTTSTTTLGYDSSPNGNNWTCNNISLTAGTTYDAMLDVPTNTSATVANYCVLSPLAGDAAPTSGNLYFSGTDKSTLGTVGVTSSKWYFEMTCVSNVATTNLDGVGIGNCGINNSAPDKAFYIYRSNGNKLQNGGSNTAYGASFTTGDVIGVAYDADAGTLVFYKNNSSQGTAFTGITGTMLPIVYARGITSTPTLALNFGQQPFTYTPPTGFVALNTYNLPTPTILQGNKYMDATLYTGDGTSTKVIVNQAQFKPDLVWVKCRSVARNHNLFDSNRGTTKRLNSNLTDVEDTASGVTSFDTNGFTLGSNTVANTSGDTYVGWQWQAGQGTNTTNTVGSITSTVSVNTTAGFSIVTFTGNATAGATVGHGLGVAPKFVIYKARNNGNDWWSYHVGLTSAAYAIQLNTTNAQNNTVNFFNSTAPSASVLTLGYWNNVTGFNLSTQNYVAYCFAEIAGFSKFGSYTGNGSTDGPFIFTGFRPKFVMTKRTDSSTNGFWNIYDSSRNGYNDDNDVLYPNSSSAEDSVQQIDLLSNGFKLRNATYPNTSGGTYIYAAFAEHPFKNANAR